MFCRKCSSISNRVNEYELNQLVQIIKNLFSEFAYKLVALNLFWNQLTDLCVFFKEAIYVFLDVLGRSGTLGKVVLLLFASN